MGIRLNVTDELEKEGRLYPSRLILYKPSERTIKIPVESPNKIWYSEIE